MDVGNESGNTSVAKQSANKQKPETAMTKNKMERMSLSCCSYSVLPGSCFVRVGCIFHYCQQRLDVQCEIFRKSTSGNRT